MVVSSACLRLKPYGIESTQEQTFKLDTGQCCASHRSQTLHVPVRVQSGAQLSLVAQSRPTLGDPMDCSTPGLPVHHQLPELAQTHVHRVGDAVQPSHPPSPPSPPALSLSQLQGLFQCFGSSRHVAPKYWSFSISPSSEYPRLISFKIDWFNLLAVQGTLRSLFEHHSSKASMLQSSAFFMVQLSHPYVTTGKTVAPGPLVS